MHQKPILVKIRAIESELKSHLWVKNSQKSIKSSLVFLTYQSSLNWALLVSCREFLRRMVQIFLYFFEKVTFVDFWSTHFQKILELLCMVKNWMFKNMIFFEFQKKWFHADFEVRTFSRFWSTKIRVCIIWPTVHKLFLTKR